MIIVLGSVLVSDGRLDAALALSQAHVARSRTEPGCLSHAVYRDGDNPQRLVFVEQWADRAALQAHFKVPASRVFVDELVLLCAERPRIDLYDATAAAL